VFFSLVYLGSHYREALGARQGAEFGRFLGLPSVILDGDALEVVLALDNDEEGAGYYGNLVVETRGILSCFVLGSVQHVGREGNKADCSTTSAGCQLFSDFGGIGSYTRGEFHAAIHVIYAAVHLYHAGGGSLY